MSKTRSRIPESHDSMLLNQLHEGIERYRKNNFSTFLSSFMAGLEIGFSFLLVVIVYSFFADRVDPAYIPKLAAFVYPLGFILVVLGKSVLFTEQTSLLSLPVIIGNQKVKSLLVLWGIVIAGNLIGGYIIGAFFVWIGPALGIITHAGIEELAVHSNHFSREVIFASAVIAGWLMALLSWIITSAQSVSSKIMVIYIVTFVIALSGLHHSIVGSIEVFAGLLVSHQVSLLDYVTFESTALVGNAIGGVVFVAILKYGAFSANKADS